MLEQVPGEACQISILGYFQNLAGLGPEQSQPVAMYNYT